MYNGRGLFVSITIPEMVFFLFIPMLLKKRWGYYERLHPSGRLSVRVQTHMQMSADKRRDQDGVPVPMK